MQDPELKEMKYKNCLTFLQWYGQKKQSHGGSSSASGKLNLDTCLCEPGRTLMPMWAHRQCSLKPAHVSHLLCLSLPAHHFTGLRSSKVTEADEQRKWARKGRDISLRNGKPKYQPTSGGKYVLQFPTSWRWKKKPLSLSQLTRAVNFIIIIITFILQQHLDDQAGSWGPHCGMNWAHRTQIQPLPQITHLQMSTENRSAAWF